MKTIKKALITLLSILLITACTITPEEKYQENLVPKLTEIDTPTGLSVSSDHINKTISLTWKPVDNATYYIVEYQKSKDYLSGDTPKQYITVTNSFFLDDQDIEKDKRYLFRVIAVYEERNDRNQIINTLKSEYSTYAETAIVDYLSVSRVIRDNKLEVYPTYSKNASVFDHSDLFDVEVKIYNKKFSEGVVVDESWELVDFNQNLISNTEYFFTAVLFVEGEQIDAEPIEFKTSINYTPEPVTNLTYTKNQRDNITISFDPITLANGVVGEPIYSIQKKLSTESKWKYIMDNASETATPLILKDTTYTDRDVLSDTDYDYRVISGYYLTELDSNIMQKESDGVVIEKCHLIDTKPVSFTAAEGAPIDENTFTVDLSWTPKSEDILTSDNLTFKIFRKEANALEGNPLNVEITPEPKTTTAKDTIKLTPEQHYATHTFYYELQYLYDNEVISKEVITAKNSTNDSTFMYEIKGTRANIDFIKAFNVNKDSTTPYADKIVLDWELTVKEKVELDINKLKITLTRRDINTSTVEKLIENQAVSSETDIAVGKYEDKTAVAGNTYEYQLIVKYEDPSSNYNGFSSLSAKINGNLMTPPSNFTASRNDDDTTITLNWTPSESSTGYKLGYKKESDKEYTYITDNESLKDPLTSTISLTATNGIEGGILYDFSLQALDSIGHPTAAANAKGSYIGPIAFNIENGDDYIKLTWNKEENIKGYKVIVYSSTNKVLYSVPVDAETPEFILDSNKLVKEVADASQFPLSEEYAFTVVPSGLTDESKCEIKKGSWIRPPKNIKASRAAYKDTINITWENVDSNVSHYNIYRTAGNNLDNKWDKVYYAQTDGSTNNHPDYKSDGIYSYTISAVINGKEGPKQNVFIDSQNTGYNIMAPSLFIVNDVSTKPSDMLLSVEFSKQIDITEYIIDIKGKEYRYSVKDPEHDDFADSNVKSAGNAYDKGASIVAYVKRSEVVYDIDTPISIRCISDKAASVDKNTSATKTNILVPRLLQDYEILNLLNYTLKTPFGNANEFFENDWWDLSAYTYEEAGVKIVSCHAPAWGSSKVEAGSFNLNRYTKNDIEVSCSNGILWAESVGAGYLGKDDVLSSLYGTIKLVLPYDYPIYTIELNDWRVREHKGTATINGEPADITKVTVNIL